jgi:hypothetical protein
MLNNSQYNIYSSFVKLPLMNISRRRFGISLLGGLAAQAWAFPPRPRLLVWIVLEQFRPDYLDTAASQLAPGGFRRFLEKSAQFPDCRHLASSFPSTTLATLATGAWPAEHGIVADSWYDRPARRPIPASEELLLATTLASQVAADSRARVSVIGMDPAQTRLFAGSRDASLYWMDEQGQFVLRGEAPDWLATFNAQRSAQTSRNRKWMAIGARPDAPPLRTLTYDEKFPAQFLSLYKASPFAQEAQFELLNEVIARDLLAAGGGFHFVVLLANSMAQLGYETGARSPLMQHLTLELDRRLETLLTQLNRAPGDNAFDVVLAGAHGAPPSPSDESRRRMAVNGENIAQAINRNLAASGFGGVEKYLYPFLYLDTAGFRDPEPIQLAAARAAMDLQAVAGYYSASGACSTHDEWERRFRNSFHLKRSGDLMLSYRPEYVEDFGQGRGISYGSLYNYDVRVPLFFLGPQFRPGVYESPVQAVDIAPTLARVMGVSPPSSSTGRVLVEALA